MKYLKTYNENFLTAADNASKHVTCKDLTGYTYAELENIFQLNLEDNSEFEVVDITGELLPSGDPNQRKMVVIELIEDFSNNSEKMKLLNFTKVNEREQYIAGVNKKLLDVIGKKYDLKIGEVALRGMLGNNQFRVAFIVEKNNTTV